MCGGPSGPGLPQVGLWGLLGHLTWGPVSSSWGGPGSENCRMRPRRAPGLSTPPATITGPRSAPRASCTCATRAQTVP